MVIAAEGPRMTSVPPWPFACGKILKGIGKIRYAAEGCIRETLNALEGANAVAVADVMDVSHGYRAAFT
jgi:hypothetical protein